MAIKDWHKPLEVMEREAIATLAELTAADPDEPLTREMAARVVATAHQIPELVERGAFPPGELDDEAMQAMAVVVDIAAAWEDEAESLREFIAGLDAEAS